MTVFVPAPALTNRLKSAGLRPTRQRLALAVLLFDGRDRHITAEQLEAEARASQIKVSLATIYNALHQFTAAGLLREVVIEPGRSWFDTNMSNHHHFYVEATGQLSDIPGDCVNLLGLPTAPDGMSIERVDVIIRLGPKAA